MNIFLQKSSRNRIEVTLFIWRLQDNLNDFLCRSRWKDWKMWGWWGGSERWGDKSVGLLIDDLRLVILSEKCTANCPGSPSSDCDGRLGEEDLCNRSFTVFHNFLPLAAFLIICTLYMLLRSCYMLLLFYYWYRADRCISCSCITVF